MSDVFLFIAPEHIIDNEADMSDLIKVSEKRGASSAHRLISINELMKQVESNPNEYTDDLRYICSEKRWLLLQFAESIKYIFGKDDESVNR
jgi:hypothetical protein